MSGVEHNPVFLKQALKLLKIKSNGCYVDATLGGGGHTSAILKQLSPRGQIIAFEQDSEIYHQTKKKIKETFANKRYLLINDNFKNFIYHIKRNRIKKVDGVLFDLGLNSWHLEKSHRGFSYAKNEFLDMRFSQKNKISAYDIINKASEQEIINILTTFGGAKYAPKIAKAITKARQQKKIKTSFDLVSIIKQTLPQNELKKRGHPARLVFQAFRIAVNNELQVLAWALSQAFAVLAKHGCLAVISFHSGEDRIVKKFFLEKRLQTKAPVLPWHVVAPKDQNIKAIILTKKAIKPTKIEIQENYKCRSARLRAIQKVAF